MNIHTQKEKDFVRKLLKLLKENDVRYCSTRFVQFVDKYAPSKIEPPEGWPGHILGRLNADMRLLWTIAQFLSEESAASTKSKWEIPLSELSELCCDAFWMLVVERFDSKVDLKTHCFAIKSNWSIHAVALSSMPTLPGRLEQILHRMEDQLIMSRLSIT